MRECHLEVVTLVGDDDVDIQCLEVDCQRFDDGIRYDQKLEIGTKSTLIFCLNVNKKPMESRVPASNMYDTQMSRGL